MTRQTELEQEDLARRQLTEQFAQLGILGEIKNMGAAITAYLRRDRNTNRNDYQREYRRRKARKKKASK